MKNAVTSGALNPSRVFGTESILDTAIAHIPNTSPEKAAIIRYFIERGADVNHQGKILSVLCRAVLVCRPDVVEVLLDAGATNTFNARGMSLSSIAGNNRNLRGSPVLTRINSLQ